MAFTYAETRYHCHDFPNDVDIDDEVAALSTAGEGYVSYFNGSRRFRSLVRDISDLVAIGVDKGIVLRASQGDLTSIGMSHENRRVCALRIGSRQNQPQVLIVGGTHAREWISVEVPFLLAKFLIDTYPAPGTNASAWTARERRVKHLVDNREIWILPMINPDGHEYSRASDRSWRKNRGPVTIANDEVVTRHWDTGGNVDKYSVADPGGGTAVILHGNHRNYFVNRAAWVLDPACVASPCVQHEIGTTTITAGVYNGVDINRNFPCASRGVLTGRKIGGQNGDAQYPYAFEPTAEDYYGRPGVTEPETQLLVNLMNAQNFRALLTYHNYAELILVPDAANNDARVKELAAHMADLMAGQGRAYRVALAQALYPTSGDMTEWAYETFPNLPAYTIELSPRDDTDDWGFSYLPDAQIQTVFGHNLTAALAVINCAPHTPLTPVPRVQAISLNLAGTSPVQAVRNCWRVFENF